MRYPAFKVVVKWARWQMHFKCLLLLRAAALSLGELCIFVHHILTTMLVVSGTESVTFRPSTRFHNILICEYKSKVYSCIAV